MRLHEEILTEEQIALLPLLKKFSRNFGMVGGTAIALHLGHRRSIDFDLFTFEKFNNSAIKNRISNLRKIDEIIVDKLGEYTFFTKGVKFTFFHYPYRLDFSRNFDDFIKIPSLLTLAAMKAHALGRRAKWKDYVDLYFIMKENYGLSEIVKKAEKVFGGEFNEKLLRSQLAYFEDVSYKEKIEFLPSFEVSDATIKRELVKFSLET